jgi:hypothetical protein
MQGDFFTKIASLLKKYWYLILILLILSLFSETIRHFILGSIMFIALGFLFLLIGAFIYFDIIKKGSKVISEVPKNFKNLSASLQKKNVDRTLVRLMAAMAVAEKRKQPDTGRFLKVDLDNVTEIQKQLIGDMIGPLSKEEIKKECFDRFLNNPKISPTEKQGLTHVLDNF